MRARCRAGVVAAVVASLALMAGAAVSDAQQPTCIGAATLDPGSGCVDRLTTVYPSLTNPHDEYLPACRPLRGLRVTWSASACVIGASASRARLHFGLVGDSHTEAWSAVLGDLGQERAWRGTVLRGNGCWLSEAVYEPGAIGREVCVPTYRDTMRWLRRHPEIDVVFVTHQSSRGLPRPAATIEPRKILGFQRTFERYPRSVRRVIVIADTPYTVKPQFDCLARAVLAAAAPAGPQCGSPRAVAVRPDAAVLAAAGLRSPRYRVVDLNDLMCSPSECYPALGGMLVGRDVGGQLTITFARTMRKQLLRRVEPLLPTPRS